MASLLKSDETPADTSYLDKKQRIHLISFEYNPIPLPILFCIVDILLSSDSHLHRISYSLLHLHHLKNEIFQFFSADSVLLLFVLLLSHLIRLKFFHISCSVHLFYIFHQKKEETAHRFNLPGVLRNISPIIS